MDARSKYLEFPQFASIFLSFGPWLFAGSLFSMSRVMTDVYGLVRPRCRGLVHAWTAAPFALAGLVLVVFTPTLSARISVAVYMVAVTSMLTTSALYHRLRVSRVAQQWLRKADHSMIGVAVAGTYTPVIVMTLHGAMAATMLALLWCGALGAAALALFWPGAHRWLVALVYVVLGWAGVMVIPGLWRAGGALPVVLVFVGGIFYMIGAMIYARRRPSIKPAVFGFHELFHSFVVAAVVSHFSAIAILVARVAVR